MVQSIEVTVNTKTVMFSTKLQDYQEDIATCLQSGGYLPPQLLHTESGLIVDSPTNPRSGQQLFGQPQGFLIWDIHDIRQRIVWRHD